MPTDILCPARVELSLRRPHNRLVIENRADGVLIHAARDNFSPRARTCFVRYLAAEGYIPARYEWVAEIEKGGCSGLKWTVENSPGWSIAEARRKAARQVLRVILGASLVWLGLMVYAFLHATP